MPYVCSISCCVWRSAERQQNQEIVDLTLDLVHGLQRVEAPKERLQLVDFCRRQLDVVESETVSERYDAGDSDVQVESLFDDGKTSKAEAKKRASRAKP